MSGGFEILRKSLQDSIRERDSICLQIENLKKVLSETETVVSKLEGLILELEGKGTQLNLLAEEDVSVSGEDKSSFTHLSVKNSILYVLKGIMEPVTSKEILDKLMASGWSTNLENPMSSVGPTLSRLKKDGYIRNTDQDKFAYVITDMGLMAIKRELKKLKEISKMQLLK